MDEQRLKFASVLDHLTCTTMISNLCAGAECTRSARRDQLRQLDAGYPFGSSVFDFEGQRAPTVKIASGLSEAPRYLLSPRRLGGLEHVFFADHASSKLLI